VDYRILEGATCGAEVWSKLSELLSERFPSQVGPEMTIQRLAVDSGYATQEVYAWGRLQAPGRVIIVKGVEGGSVQLGTPTPVDVTTSGKRIRRGARVWPVATGILKSELLGGLRLEKPTDESGGPYPPGYCHVAKYSEEHFSSQRNSWSREPCTATASQSSKRHERGMKRWMPGVRACGRIHGGCG
jgi:phage terminase large subunit GpA-like protein